MMNLTNNIIKRLDEVGYRDPRSSPEVGKGTPDPRLRRPDPLGGQPSAKTLKVHTGRRASMVSRLASSVKGSALRGARVVGAGAGKVWKGVKRVGREVRAGFSSTR